MHTPGLERGRGFSGYAGAPIFFAASHPALLIISLFLLLSPPDAGGVGYAARTGRNGAAGGVCPGFWRGSLEALREPEDTFAEPPVLVSTVTWALCSRPRDFEMRGFCGPATLLCEGF